MDASGSLCPETASRAWTHTAAREEPGFEPSPSGPRGCILAQICFADRVCLFSVHREERVLLSPQRQLFPVPGTSLWSHPERALLEPSGQRPGAADTLPCPAQWGVRSDGSVCCSRCPGCCAGPAACLGRTVSVVLPMRDTQQRPVSTPGGVCLGAGLRICGLSLFLRDLVRVGAGLCPGPPGGSRAVTVEPERACLDLGLQSGSPSERRTRAVCW